jgi:ubiquinone biosynthesis protein
VAEVHFQAGYVPAHQNIENFTQACRAIGEPLMNKPLHEISIGRLLAQLLAVTEQFEMETQPQLLLLQKSMLTAEGVGRALNPDINMWELARPLIEDWMREHRGPEARVVDELEAVMNALRTLPRVVKATETAANMVVEGGIKLHSETVKELLDGSMRRRQRMLWSMWFATMAFLTALVLAVR